MKIPSPKCERVVIPKEGFHKQSFRWTQGGAGTYLLIGCPLLLDRGGKMIPTKWAAKGAKGTQCRVASSGAKAGTRVHAIVRAPVGGRCKTSYKRK